MFENRQDTTLFLHSLTSAVRAINSSKEKNSCATEDDIQKAVNNVHTSVNNILVRNVGNLQQNMDLCIKDLKINRRLHAVIFFAALKSHGIVSPEADFFYQSVAHCVPDVSWKFYILLNVKCQWSTFFVECAKQLPSRILDKVLNELYEVSLEKKYKYYLSHLCLESIINKTVDENIDEESKFSFNFTYFNSKPNLNSDLELSSVGNQEKSLGSNSYVKVLNHLKCEEQDFDCLKVILHGLKSVLVILNKIETCNIVNILPKFTDLFMLVNQYLSSNSYQKNLELSMNSSILPFLKHRIYSNAAWEISEIYLTFILYYFWIDFQEKLSSNDFTKYLLSVNITDCLSEINEGYACKILKILNPLLKEGLLLDSHVSLLKNIFENNFPCATRAGEILLSHFNQLNNNEILTTLTQNCLKLNAARCYPLIIDAILKSESIEVKDNLLKLFYKVLAQAPLPIYDEVLRYISSNYGFSEDFKLPEFSTEVKKFQCKHLIYEEVKLILPPLFIQSPKQVLKLIIDEVLLQGSHAEALIQTLKHVPTVCSHKSAEDDLPILIETLKYYFEKQKLRFSELKNLPSLIKLLMELNLECRVISLEEFFISCIIPNFDITRNLKVELSLECLNTTLEILISEDEAKVDKACLFMLARNLGNLINLCMKCERGKWKGMAASAMSTLGQIELKHKILDDEAKSTLKDIFSSYDPAVILYASELLSDDLDISSLPIRLLWIQCCITKSTSSLEKNFIQDFISYTDLLNLLIKLLPQLSIAEWFHSVEIIKLYIQHSSLKGSNPLMITNSPFNLPMELFHLYAVLNCFLDSFRFILKNFRGDVNYLFSCFTNTITSTIKAKKSSNPLFPLSIYLDICYLSSQVHVDHFALFDPILIDLKKTAILACDNEETKSFVESIGTHGMKMVANSIYKGTEGEFLPDYYCNYLSDL